jgi:hypothetical protein
MDPLNSHGKGNGNLSLTEVGMEITRREWEGVSLSFVTHHKLETHLLVNLKHLKI